MNKNKGGKDISTKNKIEIIKTGLKLLEKLESRIRSQNRKTSRKKINLSEFF